MARKSYDSTGKVTGGGSNAGNGFASDADQPTISKADAARAVLDDGIESPVEAVEVIKSRFGIEMTRGHFSAEKARYKGREAEAKPVARRGRPPKAVVPKETNAQSRPLAASQPKPTEAEADLLRAMEAIKPLVEALGREKVKRLADLLG